MRTLRIDRDLSITEIDVPPSEWMGDNDWDAERVNDTHYAWVLDDGLFQPGLVVANIGNAKKMPLPAYVTGFKGEVKTDAMISVEELKTIIT